MATKRFSVGDVSGPVEFEIDNDKFVAIPSNRLPAGVLAKYFEKINEGKIFEAQDYFFETVLTADSAKLFFERMESVENPITVPIIGEIAAWLLGEVYVQGEVTEESKKS